MVKKRLSKRDEDDRLKAMKAQWNIKCNDKKRQNVEIKVEKERLDEKKKSVGER